VFLEAGVNKLGEPLSPDSGIYLILLAGISRKRIGTEFDVGFHGWK
jgi:hypothetical protein